MATTDEPLPLGTPAQRATVQELRLIKECLHFIHCLMYSEWCRHTGQEDKHLFDENDHHYHEDDP